MLLMYVYEGLEHGILAYIAMYFDNCCLDVITNRAKGYNPSQSDTTLRDSICDTLRPTKVKGFSFPRAYAAYSGWIMQ